MGSGVGFFSRGAAWSLSSIAELCGASLEGDTGTGTRVVDGIASLDEAQERDVAFLDNPNYADQLATTRAGVVITTTRFRSQASASTPLLIVSNPSAAFAMVGQALFPGATRPAAYGERGYVSPLAHVMPGAILEDDVTVEPFSVIGTGAVIGRGTVVGPSASIGPNCRIGRDCHVGANTSVQHALIGNRVVLHPGVRIGQDGFGYATGPKGIMKMVQVGRVIIQDDVEIGANSTVDRGAVRDTVIGEGTKIDNLVQVGHNVVIGRSCIIVGQVGISGSVTIGDGVAIGGQTGVKGHVTIGDGAQIAAVSAVTGDVPPGVRWGGMPARPVREWIRELAVLRALAREGRGTRRDDDA